jgi:hypothetical protein
MDSEPIVHALLATETLSPSSDAPSTVSSGK